MQLKKKNAHKKIGLIFMYQFSDDTIEHFFCVELYSKLPRVSHVALFSIFGHEGGEGPYCI